VLRELYRVLIPGGLLYILLSLYRENPYSPGWAKQWKAPAHVRSETEYEAMLRAHGFVDNVIAYVPDLTETPEEYSDIGFANAGELREFKRMGALLLVARKPEAEPIRLRL